MEVILLERVAKLGQMGDVVKVKSGYARNYLLPRKKALRATEENKKLFESRRAQLETQNIAHKMDADRIAGKMQGLAVVLIRQAGEAGQLYGSVNARDIAVAVKDAGTAVERQQVELNMPIKTLGLFQVPVHLHPEVAVTVTVNVARSAEEAQIQARTGAAIVHGDQAKREEEAREEARIRAEALFEEGAGPKEQETGEEGEAKDKAEAASAEPDTAAAPEAKAKPEAKPKTKKAKKKEELLPGAQRRRDWLSQTAIDVGFSGCGAKPPFQSPGDLVIKPRWWLERILWGVWPSCIPTNVLGFSRLRHKAIFAGSYSPEIRLECRSFRSAKRIIEQQ